MIDPIDPSKCPLCGKPNQCGIAAGKGTCWCFSEKVPETVLDQVPEAVRDEACVCEWCAVGRAKLSVVRS